MPIWTSRSDDDFFGILILEKMKKIGFVYISLFFIVYVNNIFFNRHITWFLIII